MIMTKSKLSSSIILLITLTLLGLLESGSRVSSVLAIESDYALSSVSLLLPYSTSKYRKPVKLESNKGCFEWTTSNPDLIEIIPIYEATSCESPLLAQDNDLVPSSQQWDSRLDSPSQPKCAKSIHILVRNPGSLNTAERNSAFIYAEDKSINRVLQCEVFVDKISSIVIETTTKTMYKDDVEELHVRAYDSVGNVFSSVVGLEFEWSIVSGNVLQIVPFRGFLQDDVALKMEQAGLQTSFVLVQGVDTGRTQIHTKLTDSNYVDISHSTTISILEPLQLLPNALLYVIPGTQIQYQLLTKKRNVQENIKLPNPNYLWSSSNPKVGMIDRSGLFVAMEIGKTELKVQHSNMSDNRVQSLVTVVNPSYLSIKIESISQGPVVNWNLISKKNYILIIELYDASGHKIYNSDINFDLQLSNEYFEPIPQSEIPKSSRLSGNDHYYIRAIKQGSTTIKASLNKVYSPERKALVELLPSLTVDQQVQIYSEITISPSVVYLPFFPKIKQTFQLMPSGGSGEYNWYTNNSAIVGVDSTGLISSSAQPGNTEIIVVDKKNAHNRGISMVYLIQPNDIKIIATPSNQVPIGEKVGLSLNLISNRIPKERDGFDQYQLPNLPWKLDDEEKIFKPDGENNTFTSLKEGSTLVSIEFFGMKSSMRLFSFERLRTLDGLNYILLALGSSKTVSFVGGPEPWYLEPKTYYQQVSFIHQDSQELVDINSVRSQLQVTAIQSNTFTLTCLQHLNGKVVLTVGNKVSTSNTSPIISTIVFDYSCQLPKSLAIELLETANEESSGLSDSAHNCGGANAEISQEVGELKVRNKRNIQLSTIGYDESGKRFSNHTTLLFEWSLSDSNKASILNTHQNNSNIKLFDKEGKLTVRSSFIGYAQEALKAQRISIPKQIPQSLKTSIDLHLISTVKLEPEHKLIYFNPTAANEHYTSLKAVGGSKNFKFFSNNTKLVNLVPDAQRRDIIHLQPIQPGYLKVTVSDLCLQSNLDSETVAPAITSSSFIQISEVISIDLITSSMVQVGKSIDLKVRAYSMSGDEFDPSQYQYMNIITNIDNPSILSVSPSMDSSQHFSLKGLDQGQVSLTVLITNPKTRVTTSSKTLTIQVYPPFKVSQQSLNLVPGSQRQIHWTGGSPARQEVTFSSYDPNVIQFSTTNIGELKALKVGQTQVNVIARILNPNTNEKEIIGEDIVKIYVKDMTGIRIYSSINTLLVGNEAKLRVIGENEEDPFIYGTGDLYFKWEIVDTNIGSLLPIYEKFNSTLELEGSFTVRVLAKNPGTTSVTVWAYTNAQISRESPSKYLFQSTSFQITVLPVIPIPTSTLLLPLNSISNHPWTKVSNVEYQPLVEECKDIIKFQTSQSSSNLITRDKIGSCILSVRRDNKLDTSKLVLVNVKPFSHLQVLPISKSRGDGVSDLKSNTMVLSISETMSFICYLRDDNGELFSEYGNVANLLVESSNNGIVSVNMDVNSSNFTIINVKGIRAGIVTLHLQLKDQPGLDDYIKIFVGKFIEPDTPVLHVGSVVNFKLQENNILGSGMKPSSSSSDQWKSSDPNVILIDNHSGKAKSMKPGKTFVNYLQNPSSSTLITVSKVADIKLVPTDNIININQGDSVSVKEYKYPLTLYSSENQEFTSNSPSLQQNIKGTCSIKEHGNFATTLFEYDNSTGQYYCLVKPIPSQSLSTITKLELIVQVYNSEKSYLVERSFNLPFESTFTILNVKGSKVDLSDYPRGFKLIIQSSKEVFADTSSKLISIQPFHDIETSKDIHKFLIQANYPHERFNDEAISITVIDKDQHHQQKKSQFIFASNNPLPEKSSWFSYLYMTIIAVIVGITGYFAVQHNRSPVVLEKSKFNTTPTHSNFNPSSSFNSQFNSVNFGNSGTGSQFQSPYRPSTPPNSSMMNSTNSSSSMLGNSGVNYPQRFQSPNQKSTIHLRESLFRQNNQNNN